MRTITDHKLNGLNEALEIVALDKPGDGGAHHHYRIQLHSSEIVRPDTAQCDIHFQNGPIPETGYNGLTNEALLAVVIDRLRGFQSGKFSCRENAIALTNCEEALMWLHKRTKDRQVRGVEGTHEI